MQLKFRSSAARDVQETYEWYEEQREGLGEDFLTELDTACAYLLGYPRSFRSRYKRLRVVSLARFLISFISPFEQRKS